MKALHITGPFSHENLGVFLLHDRDSVEGSHYLTLDESVAAGAVIVHETGTVGRLEIENLSEHQDLFIQAGEVVRGGRQDRTLGVDFVLPAKSGRCPIPAFCIERGRWHRRSGEDDTKFSSPKAYISSRHMLRAAKLRRSQKELWDSVQKVQDDLSASLQSEVHDTVSPSSYALSLEHEGIRARQKVYRDALSGILSSATDVVGCAFVLDGAVSTADRYASSSLFRRLWDKLLDAAILEAIAEAHRAKTGTPLTAVTGVAAWLDRLDAVVPVEAQPIPPRIHLETRRDGPSCRFDSVDTGPGILIHQNWIGE